MTDTDIYIQWAIAASVGLVMLARGQFTIFHPSTIYLAFHVIVFCIRPTFVHFFDFDFVFNYMQLLPRKEDMQLALWLSSAGLVVFYMAFSWFSRDAEPFDATRKRELDTFDRKAFYYTAAIFGPAGLYSIFAADLKGERINGVYVMTGTSGYINDLQNVLIPVCILFILVARWRWWSYLPFIAYILYRMNQGWGRWTFVLSCFLLVLIWCWDHGKKLPPLKFLLPAPLLLLIFINMSHDRMFFRAWLSGERSFNVERVEASRDWRDKWDTLDFANYDYLTYIVTHVPRHTKTYTYGTQYLQLFTEPIPRKLWKGKPAGAPIKFFDLNDYGNFTGLTPSLVGDGWMSGGWIGAMLTMAITGGLLGYGYTWFTRNQDIVYKACIFLIIQAMIVQFFRDGGISIFKFLLFALAPLFVWNYFSNRFQLLTAINAEREALREARERRRQGLPPVDEEALDIPDLDEAAPGDDGESDDYDEDSFAEDEFDEDGYAEDEFDEDDEIDDGQDFDDEEEDDAGGSRPHPRGSSR